MFTPPLQDIYRFINNDPSCIMNWNQTDEVCKMAVRANPKCLPFIRDLSEELILYAAYAARSNHNDFNIFECLPNITDDLVKKIVISNPCTIQHIKEQSEELSWIALSYNTFLFKYIKNKTDEMCYYCIQKNPQLIQYIENPSLEIQTIALAKSVQVYPLIRNRDERIDKLLMDMYPCEGLVYIEQTEDIVKKALIADVKAIQYMNKSLLTYDICLDVVRRYDSHFKDVPEEFHSEEMYLVAINRVSNLKYMINPSIVVVKKGLSINRLEALEWYDGYISGYTPKLCSNKTILKADDLGEEFCLNMYPDRVDPISGEGLVKGCLYGFIQSSLMDGSAPENSETTVMRLVGKYEDLRDFIKSGKNGSTRENVFAPLSTLESREYLVAVQEIIWIEY